MNGIPFTPLGWGLLFARAYLIGCSAFFRALDEETRASAVVVSFEEFERRRRARR